MVDRAGRADLWRHRRDDGGTADNIGNYRDTPKRNTAKKDIQLTLDIGATN
jgi:hypothetical protein